ncbi:AraC-type DNA-binding protein [Filimonas lacunae]|uniref:AraC-type DNA-binding protein n=1 Tax=Filimonas lacunae TaxID=477680 RepID=A0A173MMI5_9BACT|nr:helix-turn-helix domain-containing protein [Filimonas lacunae]BAV08844.1 transcriptional regulator, AraC family [Filimonas lacunae]SIS62651.1 AraC-type DNA-binding protein [Filimonas lacunae]
MYTEYLPHIALRPYIDAYWKVATGSNITSVTSRILPDGAVDIICNLGSSVSDAGTKEVMTADKVYLNGTMTAFADSVLRANALLIGVRFKPAAFALFYQLPLHDTADGCIEFERDLLNCRLAEAGFSQRLDAYFLARKAQEHHRLLPVIADIIIHKGNKRIGLLAKAHFITPRQLERQFLQSTGISAKAFSNVVRFGAALQHIRQVGEKVSLEEIAFQYGYYDQAHLANEIKKYTGHSPSYY